VKLCIVTHKVIKGDGQGRVNYEVICEAMRRGYHITLLASSIAPELQQSEQLRWIPISVKGYPTDLIRGLIFAWHSANWLHQHRSAFDLVKLNGAITWAKGDINAAHFIHNTWLRSPVHTSRLRQGFYGFYQWFYTALSAYWEKNAFQRATVVIATSKQIKHELVDIGIPQERIRVISNGVDLQEFFPGVVDRRPLGLPERVPLALFAGDIRTPRKNLDTVLHALVQVPDLHLAVAGITEGSPYLELSKQLGLSQRVHFLGLWQGGISTLMQAVDFLVFPSRYEAFGLVVLEAMAAGLPVITTATTGAAELVTPDCGIVLPNPDDVQALVRALNRLVHDVDLRYQMGQVARMLAESHSWRKMAASYVDLFEETYLKQTQSKLEATKTQQQE
jgi:glycosyltransferase involved in cell wall biosynthesis